MRSTFPLFALALTISAPAPAASELVSLPAFRSVELRGGGEVVVRPGPAQRVTILDGSARFTRFRVGRDGQLRIDACVERCPRNYHLRIDIVSPRVPGLAVAGGGSIRAAPGFAAQSQLSAAVNGGGSVDARAVEAGNVSAAVNGGGLVTVRPRRSLSAAVNGGGEIRYLGNPQVAMAVHGGGVVRPAR
ncbi:MAG: GIN domain-containing protein [Sphingomicrobium sp.]